MHHEAPRWYFEKLFVVSRYIILGIVQSRPGAPSSCPQGTADTRPRDSLLSVCGRPESVMALGLRDRGPLEDDQADCRTARFSLVRHQIEGTHQGFGNLIEAEIDRSITKGSII